MININPLNTLYYSLGKLEQNHYMRSSLRRAPICKGIELQLKKVKIKRSWCIKWCYPLSKEGFTLRQGGSQARAKKLPVIPRHLYDLFRWNTESLFASVWGHEWRYPATLNKIVTFGAGPSSVWEAMILIYSSMTPYNLTFLSDTLSLIIHLIFSSDWEI